MSMCDGYVAMEAFEWLELVRRPRKRQKKRAR